ncbi:MAG: hypothetical protein ACK4Z0_05805 [Sphingomonadaceae bacterium]
MQSEIDDIRQALGVLNILVDTGRLKLADAREGLAFIEAKLNLIELQQAHLPARSDGITVLPVKTLASISAEARAARGRHRHLRLVGGDDAAR